MPKNSTLPFDRDCVLKLASNKEYDLPFEVGAYYNSLKALDQPGTRDLEWERRRAKHIRGLLYVIRNAFDELGDWSEEDINVKDPDAPF